MTLRLSMMEGEFALDCEEFERAVVRDAPDRHWEPTLRMWVLPVNEPNAIWLDANVNKKDMDVEASLEILRMFVDDDDLPTFPVEHVFKLEPMDHQFLAINKAWTKPNFALIMEMGTGKTFVVINLALARFFAGQIKHFIVVCPTAIKYVWVWEFEKFANKDSYEIHICESSAAGKRRTHAFMDEESDKLKVMVVGVEAISQGGAYADSLRFVRDVPSMMAIDESSRIKNYKSMRTNRCIDIGQFCDYRVIMTGTPISQGIEDLFAQYRFLDWQIAGFKNFFSFRHRHCMMGGFEGKAIVGYANTDELLEKLNPFTYSVLKSECMDLPPKVYEVVYATPTPAQNKAFKDLRDFMQAEDGELTIEVDTVLERLIRYQQIAGGMFPYDEEGAQQTSITPISGVNPKMKVLADILESIPKHEKVIIWARFRPEIQLINDYIADNANDGRYAVQFHGGVSETDRELAVAKFMSDDDCGFFIANQQTGGMGITLTSATYVIYYSNSFSYQDRIQSEDRCHRKGQEFKVTYFDITLDHKCDKMIMAALERKQSMAQYVINRI
jgi:SNF2 family DNA or RNA helicase